MVNFKITQVDVLPQSSEKGILYFLSDGSIYLGKSDSSFLRVGGTESDIKFVTTLPTTDIEQNKIYLVSELDSFKLYAHNGTEFIETSKKVDMSDVDGLIGLLDGLIATINGKADSTLITVLSNRIDNHELALISTEQGLHGIRVWNGKAEYLDTTTSTWVELPFEIDTSTLTISANNISETSNKVFISANERATIQSATTDIAGLGQRVVDLETTVNAIEGTTDELVKLDENDTAGYLSTKIDDSTIYVNSGKLVAKNIEGLTTTITELNLLQGITANVQAQIDALNSVGNFTTSVDTKAELDTLSDMTANDMVIVIEDESLSDSPTSIYIYNGTSWIFSGYFKGGEIRDFTLSPIDIITESFGTLPKARYELQNALETPFVDSNGNIKSTNTQDAIKELFTYSNEGKKRVATSLGKPLNSSDTYEQIVVKITQLKELLALAITNKGVPSYSYNTLEEFANKISVIPNVTVAGTINKSPRYNITAPDVIRIELNESLSLTDVTSTLIEHIEGNKDVVHYELKFDESDKDNLILTNEVELTGSLKLKESYELEITQDNSFADKGKVYTATINKNEWTTIRSITSKSYNKGAD